MPHKKKEHMKEMHHEHHKGHEHKEHHKEHKHKAPAKGKVALKAKMASK